MRIAGLDFGEKTIGVAVSDPLFLTARPITVIRREQSENLKGSIEALCGIVTENEVELFVLGYPKNMNNSIGTRAEETLKFKKRLERDIKIPVLLWDERLSSAFAERLMLEADLSRKKRKNSIDATAAMLILQNYLDFKRSENKLKNKLKLKWRLSQMDNELDDILNEEETEEYDVIVLTDDESGEDIELIVIDSVESDGCTYLLAIESEDFESEEPVATIIKEIKGEADEFVYEMVEDEKEFDKISELFKDSEDFDII